MVVGLYDALACACFSYVVDRDRATSTAPSSVFFARTNGWRKVRFLAREKVRRPPIGRVAFDHKVQEPHETDADGTAAPPERETLAHQLGDLLTLCGRNTSVYGVRGELAATPFALVMLCAMAGMIMFLVAVCSPSWTRLSHDHGTGGISTVGAVFAQQ